MECVLEIIKLDNEECLAQHAAHAVRLVSDPAFFVSVPDKQKHKFKVTLSSMLNSKNGYTCAVAGLLAAFAFTDWSIILTHARPWLQSLVGLLNRPDATPWPAAIRALTVLYMRAAGKPELTRELGGAKLSEFIKILVTRLETIPSAVLPSLAVVLQLYPAACRAHLNRIIAKLVQLAFSQEPQACEAIVAAILAARNPEANWRNFVTELLSDIKTFLESATDAQKLHYAPSAVGPDNHATDIQVLFEILTSCVTFKKVIACKLPAAVLLDTLAQCLSSNDPNFILPALRFISKTKYELNALLILNFSKFLALMIDVASQNRATAFEAARAVSSLIDSNGWIDPKHNVLVARLIQRVFRSLEPVSLDKYVAAGLPDYVNDPSSFECTMSQKAFDMAAALFASVVKAADSLPSSVRYEIERFFLKHKGPGLRTCVLYPDKFSILPIVISQNGTDGYEALVHPRFPPLGVYNNQDIPKNPEMGASFAATQKQVLQPSEIPISVAAGIDALARARFDLGLNHKDSIQEHEKRKLPSDENLVQSEMRANKSLESVEPVPKVDEDSEFRNISHLLKPIEVKIPSESPRTTTEHQPASVASSETSHGSLQPRDKRAKIETDFLEVASPASDADFEIPEIIMDSD